MHLILEPIILIILVKNVLVVREQLFLEVKKVIETKSTGSFLVLFLLYIGLILFTIYWFIHMMA